LINPICTDILDKQEQKHHLAAFCFTGANDPDAAKTIYEFDASMLETVGTPFEGHTKLVNGLALSFDCALLPSSSHDQIIKLWAFKAHQLLASFNVHNPEALIVSPDSCKLAYAISAGGRDQWICICDTQSDVLAQARVRIPLTHSLVIC
jgi:WD40 repeat protein